MTTKISEETLEGAGDIKIFFRSWHPDGKARGVVVIVPGFNAHSAYYSWVALHLTNADFARDPNIVRAMNDDPLIANETQPTKTLAEMVRADERLEKEFPRIKLPVLILHGTSDKATKPSGSQLFYDAAGSTDKTLKFYEGGYHDLLNDTDKQRVMSDIRVWINAHLPA